MSTQKPNQPGNAPHKHVTFTPANEASQGASDSQEGSDNSASSAYNEPSNSGTKSNGSNSSQNRSSDSGQSGKQGQDGQQGSWLDQQQWLKNIDVNQIKDLGTKALDQVNRLTPTQKVVGGALLVSGLSWLALRSKSSGSRSEAYRLYRGSADSKSTDNKSSDSKSNAGSSKWKSSDESVYRGTTSRSYGEDDYATDL